MEQKNTEKKKTTYTKKAVTAILVVALFDLQLSYILAWFGKPETAINLSITICTEIIAVMLGYFLKAFLETREEEKLKLERDKMNQFDSPDSDSFNAPF